jgi:transcriptional regulator with GAF, ATPase, and Fis domain
MKLTSPGALVVLLWLAACGGGTGSFTDDYNEAVRPLAELGAKVGTEAREFDRLARRTRLTRENLATLEPPEEARDELDALLGELQAVSRDLASVADATRSDDPVRQRRAAQRLVRSSERVERAEIALKRAIEG